MTKSDLAIQKVIDVHPVGQVTHCSGAKAERAVTLEHQNRLVKQREAGISGQTDPNRWREGKSLRDKGKER